MLLRTHPVSLQERRGIVLLSVLVVVVILTLAAYQYSEYMLAEYQAASSHQKITQTKALAMSGVNYVAVSLSNYDYFTNTLNSNPFDNAQYFQDIVVQTDPNSNRQGKFCIVSLMNPDDPLAPSQPYRYGVYDEAGKINLNALLQYDSKGTVGYNMLMLLPNMTDDIANSILDWLDSTTTTPRSSGAKDEYYMQLSPAYHCKNGPMDTLEELLLVKGVTAQLLFGNDRNRNGVLDSDEDGSANQGQVDLGWSAYLTVYSREPNATAQGNPRIYLNSQDLNSLNTQLQAFLSQEMTTYILAYRMFGAAASGGTTAVITISGAGGQITATTMTNTPGAKQSYKPVSGNDANAVNQVIQTKLSTSSSGSSGGGGGGGLKSIASVYALVNSSVTVSVGSGQTAHDVTLTSPLNDSGQLQAILPLLLDQTTTSQAPDLTPRINVNIASQTVLSTLPGFTAADIQSIISNRPDPSSGASMDPIFSTPAWLLTQGNISPTTMQTVERFITARSFVYRFQSVGYFNDGSGPSSRIEAVVDTNFGRPRIVYLRDITELGKGGFQLTTDGSTTNTGNNSNPNQ